VVFITLGEPQAHGDTAEQAAEKVNFRKTPKNKSPDDAVGAICWPSVMVLYPLFRQRFDLFSTFSAACEAVPFV
jgi:hypothetical protein